MSTLNAALPLREVDRLSPSVRDELQLDMPGRLDQPFNIESTLSESSLRFAVCPRKQIFELRLLRDLAYPSPPTAEGRLQDHGIPYLAGEAQRFLDVVKNLLRPRQGGDAHPPRELPALYLVLRDLECLGGGSDELHSGLIAGGRERGVLREVTVPWVDRINRSLLGDGEYLIAIRVALFRSWGSEGVRFVRQLHVKGFLVNV